MARLPQEMLLRWEAQRPDQTYLRQAVGGRWQGWSWREAVGAGRRMAAALAALGLRPGDRVGLISKNCAHWFLADFAMILGSFVSVPVYPTANARTLRFVLEHSEAGACFVGPVDHPEELEEAFPPGMTTIALPGSRLPCSHSWEQLLEAHDPLEEIDLPEPDSPMTLLYTSGSTGEPKGAIHSWNNFAFVGAQLSEFFGLRANDRVLSYLPLAHCTERAYVEAASIYGNGSIHFAESLDSFMDDLRRARPTLFGSVPRLWKRFQISVLDRMGHQRLERLRRLPVLGGIVRRRIRERLGLQEARWLGSGSAPIAPALLHWYEGLEMPISEGWGMTETFAYGTQVPPGEAPRIGAIGRPLPGAELEIGPGDEILFRCPAMMQGYYKQPELSREAFDEHGFLRTGDCGSVDDDGFVRITGRAKEIFKTAKGKYVAPVPIESLIAQNPLVEQACVVGLGMTQPVALLQLGMQGIGSTELARERLTDTLRQVNDQLEPHERISRFIVVRDEWTVESGLLTPTLKVRRGAIESRYQALAGAATGRVAFEDESPG